MPARERKQLKLELLEETNASQKANKPETEDTNPKQADENKKPLHTLVPLLPYRGRLFQHSGGFKLFYVFLASPSNESREVSVLRHKTVPKRYTPMVEKLIPEFAQLHESVTSKILKKLATLFITKEIREIYRAFSTEFDVLTAQACCDLDQCRGGSPLRIDVPAELDPSKFTWSDFDMKGRPKMSFEIQKAKW